MVKMLSCTDDWCKCEVLKFSLGLMLRYQEQYYDEKYAAVLQF